MDLVRLLGMEATYSHRKLGAILGATTMYVAAVLMLRPAAGDSILIAVIVPVLITAWSFGARAALLASLLAIMLNVFFVTVVGDEGIAAWLLMGGALARGAALTGAAVLVGRLRDLRAQHERELSEREAVQSALRESEECYRALFESAPLGIAITEAHGIIVQTNPALEEMLGRTADELRGSRLRDFRLDTSPPPRENIFTRLAGAENGTLRYERQFLHSSGETVWAYVTAAKAPARAGQPEHVFRMFEDITERKRAEDALREAEAERLDRTRHLASIGQLAAGVAHEINNPLNSVMGFTQLVLGEESLSAQARSDLETVYAESQRASKIVQNLLSFARKREPERRPVDVRSVVERACHLKEYDLRKHAIELRTHFSKSLPLILGDEQQLTEVMLNLLTNAEQAIASAGRPGAVTVTCAASDGLVEITVANDGPGIPPEVLGRIFEPFFTTKEVGGGTGLGLSMCQGTVREHDGDLWAESTLDGDTTFFITLPVPLTPLTLPTTPDAEPEHPSVPRMRILVVDDEPRARDLMARALAKDNHTVEQASDGDDAWRQIRSTPYDCVIADLRMPGTSGQELYRLVEESDPDLAARFIFITGDTMSPDTNGFLSSVAAHSLMKPIDITELRRRVAELQEVGQGAEEAR
ncbi:MAG: PAS domain S-box protein [Chloroflexi bacterium]|nr:PAS domain S-box protein [Chloroflexota bacterium]